MNFFITDIRNQQRNGRKSLTTVQGLGTAFDVKKICKALKRDFSCNGTVIEHEELGDIIQLQGDQRQNVARFLYAQGLVRKDLIKVHGA
jgi:translation initiation factor 1